MTVRLLRCAAVFSALLVLAISGNLLWFALPIFQGGALTTLFSWQWRPLEGAFGILPMLVGSLCLALPALCLAFPVALGLCAFMHGVGPPRLKAPVLRVVRFMTSVPTVVYGLVSAFLLVPLVRNALSGSGFSWLAALLTVSVLILPTLVLILDGQFQLVQEDIHLSARALGFSPLQQFLKLTLPLSMRGLWMAAMLGFGRAIGDTLIPLMVAGNAPQVPHALSDAIRTLTAHIALVVATDSQTATYGSLFACGVMLFLMSVLVNVGLHGLRKAHAKSGGRHA